MDLKKITKAMLAASALGVSGLATAASFAPPPLPMACVQDAVVLPCERSAWDLGIEAIYVQQASGTNWYVADRVSSAEDGSLIAARGIQHDPRWAWGFRLEGSYHWGTGSDLTVNWTHFQKKSNVTYGAGLVTNLLPPLWEVNGFVPENDTWDLINDWSDSRFDQVNIEFGQNVEYGRRVQIRSHSGITFIRLDQERQVTGFAKRIDDIDPPVDILYEAALWQKSRYNGVGIRFGQDLSYDVGSGFAVYGRYAVSATAGTSKIQIASEARQKVGTGAIERPDSIADFAYEASKRTIVAGLETRLGVKYTYPMAQGDLIIDAAYQVNAYQGILQQMVPSAAGTGTGNGLGLGLADNNWGYHGASIGLKWIGNA